MVESQEKYDFDCNIFNGEAARLLVVSIKLKIGSRLHFFFVATDLLAAADKSANLI